MNHTLAVRPGAELVYATPDYHVVDNWCLEGCYDLAGLYPTYKQQVRICYLARTYGDGFDPYDAAACQDELRMRSSMDAWTYFDEIEDCYDERSEGAWQQRLESLEAWHYEDNPEVYDWDGYPEFDDLGDRIVEALAPDAYKQPSKKRRVSDRKARYERRDGSPRDKRKRGVCKWGNDNLRRGARRRDSMALANIGIDGDYVAPMHEHVPAGWDVSEW